MVVYMSSGRENGGLTDLRQLSSHLPVFSSTPHSDYCLQNRGSLSIDLQNGSVLSLFTTFFVHSISCIFLYCAKSVTFWHSLSRVQKFVEILSATTSFPILLISISLWIFIPSLIYITFILVETKEGEKIKIYSHF